MGIKVQVNSEILWSHDMYPELYYCLILLSSAYRQGPHNSATFSWPKVLYAAMGMKIHLFIFQTHTQKASYANTAAK